MKSVRATRPVVLALEPRTMLDASAPAAIGAMGDSFSNANRYGGINPSWIQQLVDARGLNFGAPNPSGTLAYAYDMPSQIGGNFESYHVAYLQAPALVRDIQAGAPIQAAVLEVGAHDLGPIGPTVMYNDANGNPVVANGYNDNNGNPITDTYLSIYNGQLSGTNLQGYIDRMLGQIMQAAGTVQQAGANMVVANVPDFGDTPFLQDWTMTSDPSKRAIVTAAIDSANVQLKTLTDAAGMPLLDFKSLVDWTTTAQVVDGVTVNPGIGNSTGTPPAMYQDSQHPGGIPSGLFANMVVQALDGSYGYNIDPMTDQEILAASGVTPPAGPPSYYNISPFVHQVDHVAPVSTLVNLPTPTGANGWSTGPVTVTLSASDNRFGSGVATVQYSTDDGTTWQDATPTGAFAHPNAPYGADGAPEYAFTLSADGVYSVLVRATDAAGNQEVPHALPTIQIDQTPPTSAPSADPSILWPPDGGTVMVTVTGKITDNLSGVDLGGASYTVADSEGVLHESGPVNLSADGSYAFEVPLVAQREGDDLTGRVYTITISGRDLAGNVGSWSVTVNVPHDQSGWFALPNQGQSPKPAAWESEAIGVLPTDVDHLGKRRSGE